MHTQTNVTPKSIENKTHLTEGGWAQKARLLIVAGRSSLDLQPVTGGAVAQRSRSEVGGLFLLRKRCVFVRFVLTKAALIQEAKH